MATLSDACDALIDALAGLQFSAPVTHVYNPLVYARAPHELYLSRYAEKAPREVLLMGMNPGPFGMAQTGVPFGEISLVRDWLGIEAQVQRPASEHAKRPIVGFACTRSEVSGARLWGWAKQRYQSPDAFFSRYYVHNYCPLVFMEESGRNFTPDKLPPNERAAVYAACDRMLQHLVAHFKPRFVVGVGAFAEERARQALPQFDGVIGRVLHPSPASPLANKNWAQAAEQQLQALGVTP